MKHIVTFAAAALLSCIASAQTPESLQVKTYTLSNGLTVWINEDHSQPKAFGVLALADSDSERTAIPNEFDNLISEEAFWKEYVAGRNIVWTVVGDRKKVDMEGLEKFGEVVPVKKKQLFR